MKFILALFLFFGIAEISFSFGQSWVDSLKTGQKKYHEKDFSGALSSLVEAQKNSPGSINLSKDIGNAAYRKGDFETAEKAFLSATHDNTSKENNAKYWHNVGNSQLNRQQYQAAVTSYKNALRLNPNNEKTRYNLAEALRKLQEQEKKNQNQQNKDSDQNKDSKDNKQNNQKDNSQDKNKDENKDKNKDDKKGNPQQNQGDSGDDIQQKDIDSGKLPTHNSEKLLDDLLKEELKTMKKVHGTESKQSHTKSTKQW